MKEINSYTVKTTSFDHTLNQKYGGYITYWTLYGQLWSQASSLPKGKIRRACYRSVIYKTPWWLFLKPLGCLFSRKIFSKGFVKVIDDERIIEFNANKNVIIKFLGIPFFAYSTKKFSEKEQRKHAGLEK